MAGSERLICEGICWDTVGEIMQTPQPTKHLLILGLPMKTAKGLSYGPESCAFNGSKSTRHA